MMVFLLFLLALIGCGQESDGGRFLRPQSAGYAVAGSVKNLSGTIVLQNNGADDLTLTSSGTFTFRAALPVDSDYKVTIQRAPASQTCTVIRGSGTIQGADVSDVEVECRNTDGSVDQPTASLSVLPDSGSGFGTVDVGASVLKTIQVVNTSATAGADARLLIWPSLSTPFSVVSQTCFSLSSLPPGGSCAVTVRFAPTAVGAAGSAFLVQYYDGRISRTVSAQLSGTGRARALLSIGGSISGLSGMVVLANNGETLSRSANGAFSFPTSLADGVAYHVTVQTDPAGQTCTVSNGDGTLRGSNITNVAVVCTANAVPLAVLSTNAPSGVDFGYTLLNTGSERFFNLQNTGQAAATSVSFVSISGPFALKGGTFPTYGSTCAANGVLNAGMFCTLGLTFTPDAGGPVTGRLVLQYFNGQIARTVTVDLAGNGGTCAPFGGGDGSAANPFLISTLAHLRDVSLCPSNSFRLTSDLNLQGAGFSQLPALSGSFDGGKHTISNWTQQQGDAFVPGGLFMRIDAGGRVSNLKLAGFSINGSEDSDSSGMLAGKNLGTIENVMVSGHVSGQYLAGGLVGENLGTIKTSAAEEAYVSTGNGLAGGLAGINWNAGVIQNSYVKADLASGVIAVSSAQLSAGGITAYNGGLIDKCYAAARVSGPQAYAGVLVGRALGVPEGGNSVIQNSYWANDISDGSTRSAGGTGVSLASLSVQSLFSGWDFLGIWKRTSVAPVLLWSLPSSGSDSLTY